MKTAIHVDSVEQVARGLIQALHQAASADAFAERLAEVEALPDRYPSKQALIETVRMAMAVRNRLEVQQQRERGMLAVIESAQDLAGRLDRDGLLHAIVSRARTLLGADLGWLSIHDAERGEFQVLVTDGALSQSTARMVTHSNHGVAGKVLSSRLPFTTPDYLHDTRFEHDAVLDEAFRNESIAALVGVPLMWEGTILGLLFVADRYHRMHTAHSVSILSTLATHAAVALKNARDFERANDALQKADQARAELEAHLRNTQAAADAHAQMTSLLARGASLSLLCQSVAQQLRGALLVADEAGHVVSRGTAEGYAGGALQQFALHGEHGVALGRALRESRRLGRSMLAYDGADGEACRVMTVVGGDDALGSIALFRAEPLQEIEVRTFERSASVIGIVLLSHERMEAARSRGAATLLRSLVSARQDDPALLTNEAERHGIDLAQPLTLLLLQAEGCSAGYATRRLRELPALAQTLVDEDDGGLLLLCSATRAHDVRDAAAAWSKRELGAACRGVLSRPVGGPGEIPALYATLKRTLGVLGRIGVHSRVVGQNELALYSTLFETHDQASLTTFLQATIGPLLAHDQRRGTELAATLLSWFDHNQGAKAAAAALGIHVNTMRQRLATIESLLGHWGQAARELEIHIALRLWRLRLPSADGPLNRRDPLAAVGAAASKPRATELAPVPRRLPNVQMC